MPTPPVSPSLPVHFFRDADGATVASWASLDPRVDATALTRGVDVWIVGTWAHLARAGYAVSIGPDLPGRSAMVVFHASEKRALARALRARAASAPPLVLVGVRGDLNAPHIADFEVLQNGVHADGRARWHVPHWPQPGLVARDAARADRLEVVCYKGDPANLHASFRDASWTAGLAALGLSWRVDDADRWPDYRDVDVVIAVRPPDAFAHRHKPASKLQNAWLAGVPLLAGAEAAYRELRTSPDDYLEVADATDALRTLRSLRGDPAWYARLRAQAAARGASVTPEEVRGEWQRLLFETLPERVTALGLSYFTPAARRRRVAWRALRRALQPSRRR